jgi:hypothetical protein
MVAGNRVFGSKIYGVWDRVLGRMYCVWELGAGDNIWWVGTGCLGAKYTESGTGCWGEYMVAGNRVFGGKIYGVWERVLGRMYCVWEQGVGDLKR